MADLDPDPPSRPVSPAAPYWSTGNGNGRPPSQPAAMPEALRRATGAAMRALAAALPSGGAQPPRRLVLAGSDLGDAGGVMLLGGLLAAPTHGALAGLALLDLSRCGLGGGGLVALGQLLRRSHALRVLAISSNPEASTQGMLCLAESLEFNHGLEELHWAGGTRGGSAAERLPLGPEESASCDGGGGGGGGGGGEGEQGAREEPWQSAQLRWLRVLADAIGVQRRLTLLDISHRHLGVCPARFGAAQAHAAPEHRLAGCNPMHPRRTAPPHSVAASTTYGCRRMASTTGW